MTDQSVIIPVDIPSKALSAVRLAATVCGMSAEEFVLWAATTRAADVVNDLNRLKEGDD